MDSARIYLLNVIDAYKDELMALIMESVDVYDRSVDVECIFACESLKYRHTMLFIARHLRCYYRVRCITKHDARILRLEMLDYLSSVRLELHEHMTRLFLECKLGVGLSGCIRGLV